MTVCGVHKQAWPQWIAKCFWEVHDGICIWSHAKCACLVAYTCTMFCFRAYSTPCIIRSLSYLWVGSGPGEASPCMRQVHVGVGAVILWPCCWKISFNCPCSLLWKFFLVVSAIQISVTRAFGQTRVPDRSNPPNWMASCVLIAAVIKIILWWSHHSYAI